MENDGQLNAGEITGGSPTATADQSGQPQQTTQPGATDQGAAQGQQGQPPADGPMVPSYRLREVTERNRQLEAFAGQLQARLEALEKRSGTPQERPQDDAETRAIRDQFAKMFPNLAKLNDFDPEQLSGLLQQAPQQQQQWEQYWTNVGQNTLRTLQSKITEIYGDKTDPVTRSVFESAFISWVERDPQARERYLSQDPSLVEDFWKRTNAAVLDPVRKSAAAQVSQRVDRIGRLPSAAKSNTALPAQKPPKPKTEEDLHDAAWNALSSAR